MVAEANMTALTEQASKLLDFSQKLDISLLDNVVGCMYGGEGRQVCVRFKFRNTWIENICCMITLTSKVP